MSGRRSRQKGKRGEREACEALLDVLPGLQRQFGQSRKANEACDIDGPNNPFWIEVKRQKVPNIRAAYQQAIDEAKGRRPVLVASKADRGPWLFTVDVEGLRSLGRLFGFLESSPCHHGKQDSSQPPQPAYSGNTVSETDRQQGTPPRRDVGQSDESLPRVPSKERP